MREPIILGVRHGRTELNDPEHPRLRAWENPPLNKTGILDAKMAAQLLKIYKPQMVYCSDLSRDWQTAQIIAQDLGNLPIEVDYGLRTADMGELSGMLDEDAYPLVDRWYKQPWWNAPGGESNNDFLRRFYPAFDLKADLARESEAFRPSVVVTHGRNLAALHARSEFIPQWEAEMPYPGGSLGIFLNEANEPKVHFLGESEPVHKDV